MLNPLSQLLAAATRGHTVRADITPDWQQGRSVFGGLQAVLAVAAMRKAMPEEGLALPLRVLQATFVAPIAAGTVEAQGRLVRAGRHTAIVEAHLGEALSATGVFGAARTSVVAVTPSPVGAELPGEGAVLPAIPGVIPAFTQHFNARFVSGALPYSGRLETHQVIAIDMLDDGPVTESHVIALADFAPPIGLTALRPPQPGSTVTWMLELLRDRWDDLGLCGWRIEAQLVAARDGYTSQRLMLWAPDGTPAALGHQHMVVFG